MTQLGDIKSETRSAGFAAWLALAAVLLLQIGSAAHEAQHTTSDLGDICEVCVQLEGGTAADASTDPVVADQATAIRIDTLSDATVVASPYRTPQLRAPPALI